MNSLYDIETFVLKKKSKEQSDREWQYFAKEQEKAFAELLIEKGKIWQGDNGSGRKSSLIS